MGTPEEIAASLVEVRDTSRDICNLEFGEHQCRLRGCPKDDPDHMHRCYANDFDFTDGEWQRRRMNLISEVEFNVIGAGRAADRTAEMLPPEEREEYVRQVEEVIRKKTQNK